MLCCLALRIFFRQPLVSHVSIAAHPESIPNISPLVLTRSLLAKQSLLAAHGVSGSAVTQLCFDATTIQAWLVSARAAGFTLPLTVGVSGPVSLHKLLAVAARVGVGESLRFLTRRGLSAAVAVAGGSGQGTYHAAGIIGQLCGAEDLGQVQGIHCFTFNAVKDAVEWAHESARQADIAAHGPSH
jgi:methylenetetrahydrofolate reductase (NADPH)